MFGTQKKEETDSLAHTRWNCKYHIVFAPKYRRQAIYGQLRVDIGGILRKLCEYKGIEIIEAETCPDHIHMLVSIPPKYSVSQFMGYLKGKSSLMMCRLSLSAKELISSDALIFLCKNGGETMKYECLKLEERRIIEAMYAEGAKPGEIAQRVGKCQATIYRELERGKTGKTDSRFRQGYSAEVAEARVNRSYRNRGRRKAAQ